MKLSKSNPHIRSAVVRKAALRVSAETSSSVEGIRAPFVKKTSVRQPSSKKAFIAYWKRRAAKSAR